MEKIIEITVRAKVATVTNPQSRYVCGNSDYVAVFDFDDDWAEYAAKTARFRYNGVWTDVVFTGNRVAIPAIANVYKIQIGVFAGELHTTTPAVLIAEKSILCGTGVPAPPATPDVYAQIMETVNQAAKDTQEAAELVDAFTQHVPKIENGTWWIWDPVTGVYVDTGATTGSGGGSLYRIGAGLKLDTDTNTLSVNTVDDFAGDNTLPMTASGVQEVVGNIDVLLKTI